MIAGLVLSNLFYVVGAIVAATVVSAFVLLRHRRPRSLESGIEMFSRELRALRPERPAGPGGSGPGPRMPDRGAGNGSSEEHGGLLDGPAPESRPGDPDDSARPGVGYVGGPGGALRPGLPRPGLPRPGRARAVTPLLPQAQGRSTGPNQAAHGRDGAGARSPEEGSEPG